MPADGASPSPQYAQIGRDGRASRITTEQAEAIGAQTAFRAHCEQHDPGIGGIHAENDCITLATLAGEIAELVEKARTEFDKLNVARDVVVPGVISFTRRSKFNGPMIAEMIAEAFEDALSGHAGGVLVACTRAAVR